MQKIISIILVLFLLIAGITGCINNDGEPENYIPEIKIDNYTPTETMPEIIPPTDYSVFLGDWYNYSAAISSVLRIFNVEGNEVTFTLIDFEPIDEDSIVISDTYTLPIVNGQIQFEQNIIWSGGSERREGLSERRHTLTFEGDYVFLNTHFTSSWVMPDGTVEVSEFEDDFKRQFVSVESLTYLVDSLTFGEIWSQRVDEVLSGGRFTW